MQQQTKWLVAIGAVATSALAVSLWLLLRDPELPPKSPPAEPEETPEEEVSSEPAPTQPRPAGKPNAFPLQVGSSGHQVERLHVWLLRNFGGKTAAFGIFDHHTQQRVRKAFGKDYVDLDTYEQKQMDRPIHQQRPAA